MENDRITRQELTHFDETGRARMVDVGLKSATARVAIARSIISMQEETLRMVREGSVAKGDVLAVAQVAAVMAAKRTSDVIPMCHPILITGVDAAFAFPDDTTLMLDVTVGTTGPTGVEMEALTAAAIGALTVYDMCKAIDRAMSITFLGLLEKDGGKSGHFVRQQENGRV